LARRLGAKRLLDVMFPQIAVTFQLRENAILRAVIKREREGPRDLGLDLSLSPSLADRRAQATERQRLAHFLFGHAVLLGDLLIGLSALLEPREGLVLIDRMQLLGRDRRRQRELEPLGFVDIMNRTLHGMAGLLAIDHAEGRKASIAVGDRIEIITAR